MAPSQSASGCKKGLFLVTLASCSSLRRTNTTEQKQLLPPFFPHITYVTATFKGGSKNKGKPLDCCTVLPNAASMTLEKVNHKTEHSWH